MWLFCKEGFFSAVQHKDDPGLIHVRARFAGDLEKLCEHNGLEPRVVETPDGDYRWRMDFAREDWIEIAAREAREIDYCNFKNAVHDGTPRDRAYLRVWSVMSDAQARQNDDPQS